MHTLVLSGVLSVWIFTDTFVDGALSISYSGSNQVNSTNYILKCDIQGFSGQATMSKNGTLISQCFPSGCITPPNQPYSFRQDATAIYVDFSTLAASEDGIKWTCAHIGDTSVHFNVKIEFGEATTAGSTEGPTVTTEMSSTVTSQEQTTSSQNPFIVPSHNTEKTETTVMTTTDNDLTSSSLHVSSEVTTPIKTESDDLTDLGVSAIIAIAISGFIFLFLIIILIICCCQYYWKKSKGKTMQTVQEIHDDVVPTFGPNFYDHRYGNNGINDSNAHVARDYNRYQGESDRGYNVRSKHQSDNYNRRRSNKENITENRKHHPKQVQGNNSHGFTQSIPNDIINRYNINGMNTYALHKNYQNTRTHYREQAGSSPDRYEYRGSYLPHEFRNHNRSSSPYMIHLQEQVPRDLEGLIIYKGNNKEMNKQSRLYY